MSGFDRRGAWHDVAGDPLYQFYRQTRDVDPEEDPDEALEETLEQGERLRRLDAMQRAELGLGVGLLAAGLACAVGHLLSGATRPGGWAVWAVVLTLVGVWVVGTIPSARVGVR